MAQRRAVRPRSRRGHIRFEVLTLTDLLEESHHRSATSLHLLGVTCGLAAGAWLGAAETPTKLVTLGLFPFLISLAMVAGVFVARWTLPTVMKGTGCVFVDLREKSHLIVWAILAAALWADANTLTVFGFATGHRW
jgi:hypothetical protein